MRMRYLGVLLLLGAVWGASFLFIKIGVQEMAPETLVMLRLVIAAVVPLAVLTLSVFSSRSDIQQAEG